MLTSIIIYLALTIYVISLLLYFSKCKKWSNIAFAIGFLLLSSIFISRWITYKHLPLKNMFEVFLCVSVLIYPVSRLCAKLYGSEMFVVDIFMGILFLIPLSFVFDNKGSALPPILQSIFFAPHVLSYMISYTVLLKAAIHSVVFLVKKMRNLVTNDANVSFGLIRFAFPLLVLGFALGSMWGVYAWGRFWNWDPKELWSLATIVIYAMYFAAEKLVRLKSTLPSVLAILGGVFITLTLTWVNLSRLFPGLHNYS